MRHSPALLLSLEKLPNAHHALLRARLSRAKTLASMQANNKHVHSTMGSLAYDDPVSGVRMLTTCDGMPFLAGKLWVLQRGLVFTSSRLGSLVVDFEHDLLSAEFYTSSESVAFRLREGFVSFGILEVKFNVPHTADAVCILEHSSRENRLPLFPPLSCSLPTLSRCRRFPSPSTMHMALPDLALNESAPIATTWSPLYPAEHARSFRLAHPGAGCRRSQDLCPRGAPHVAQDARGHGRADECQGLAACLAGLERLAQADRGNLHQRHDAPSQHGVPQCIRCARFMRPQVRFDHPVMRLPRLMLLACNSRRPSTTPPSAAQPPPDSEPVIVVMGQPGLDKKRLVHEAISLVGKQDSVRCASRRFFDFFRT